MYFKLSVLNIDGAQQTTNQVIKKYRLVRNDYDFEANESSDVTSVEGLFLFFHYTKMDYKNFRKALTQYVISVGGVSGLSEAHKILVARDFCVAKSDRDAIFSVTEQVEAGIEFHLQSVACR